MLLTDSQSIVSKKMNKIMTSIILLSASALLSSCAYINTGPGSSPSATAPRLITPPGQKQVWDDASLFGPVPAAYQREGDQYCSALGDGKAIGYHPNPRKYDGSYFGKRGYLCAEQ
jgi:hypothetical protein